MVIGEAPGRQEDSEGKPFIGKAGKKLNWFLRKAGIRRKDIFITNTVKCFPPKREGTYKPRPEEITACKKWILKEIVIIKPKLVILAGATAMESLIDLKGITTNSGLFFVNSEYGKTEFFVILHPVSLLYNPENKKDYLRCARILKKYLSERSML
jgi:DNA polymerase